MSHQAARLSLTQNSLIVHKQRKSLNTELRLRSGSHSGMSSALSAHKLAMAAPCPALDEDDLAPFLDAPDFMRTGSDALAVVSILTTSAGSRLFMNVEDEDAAAAAPSPFATAIELASAASRGLSLTTSPRGSGFSAATGAFNVCVNGRAAACEAAAAPGGGSKWAERVQRAGSRVRQGMAHALSTMCMGLAASAVYHPTLGVAPYAGYVCSRQHPACAMGGFMIVV